MNLVLNFLTHLQFGLFKIKTCLEVKPELWGGAEETRKPDGRIGTHTTTLTDDFINPRRLELEAPSRARWRSSQAAQGTPP